MALDRAMLRKAIPSTLTLGNGLCGVGALIVLSGFGPDKTRLAAVLVFAGWLFDMFDGIAARRLGATGAFGAALDSLCDAVTFDALPAVLICAGHDDRASIACAFAFAAGAFIRLARYIAHAPQHEGPRWFFDGLPSPAAAMMIATAVILQLPAWEVRTIAVVAAIAMVSQLPYPDVPRLFFARRTSWIVAAVLVAGAIFLGAGVVIAAILAVYLLSGPAVYLARRNKTRLRNA